MAVDVAIAGGGMVGAALALALVQREFSVALIESREPVMAWDDGTVDLRVSAITRASQHLFERLGVWEAILSDRATPYQHMHVWDRAGIGEIHFDAADLAEPDLGHIVENRVIVRALWRALEATSVQRLVPASISSQRCDAATVRLRLDDGSELTAGLLVGADGARSQVRERAGIQSRQRDYGQQAVVATVRAERGNQETAWQRFMPAGPLALLPVNQDLCSIVWTTRPDEAEHLLALEPEPFNEALTEAAEARLGRLELVGTRASFPLQLQHAEHYVQPGLALVGDAAHVIHPLAGQGVNLGFLDVGALVDALTEGREAGRAPGALRGLRRYERMRRGHNTATQLTMDGFKRLFSNRSGVLSVLRNAGLGAAAHLAPLKRQFERVALGHGVELPSLNRPDPR
jgi:2-octaprenylphenol hydroxylase